ncbi:MAG: YvcK family protein [Candidatus Omnitrophota bacterium]|nr:YvcK family protein [Candidatus Omnitrophota bacterium]
MQKRQFFKWLYPGMKIKRWILISFLGIFVVGGSSAVFLTQPYGIVKFLGLVVICMGIILIILGIGNIISSFITIFLPQREREFINILYQKRLLERGPRIVTVGGGTGLSVLLHGLKEYTNNITAIVTVADNGGSSGRLREQFDVLPPGDIRNCLVALADAEPLMRDLFQFRFDKNSEFHGHNFGNIFITAMTKLTGDFEVAIKESSKILAIRGQVVPSTLDNVSLVAEYQDGSRTEGEAQIPKKTSLIRRVYLRPQETTPTKEALRAIQDAEVIIFGPGSLYTSIIPNLLVKGIPEAIANSPALKIYVCNIMTQNGETDGYSAFDHVEAIVKHTNPRIIDCCIVNVARIPKSLLGKYELEKSFPVLSDSRRIRELGYRVIEENLISTRDFVRHDADKLSKLIINLLESYKVAKK